MTHEEFCDWIVETNFPEWKGYYVYNLTPMLLRNKDGYYWTLLNFERYDSRDNWKPHLSKQRETFWSVGRDEDNKSG